MGTAELITTKIHVDHMIGAACLLSNIYIYIYIMTNIIYNIYIMTDSLARYCPRLERLEFRWDNETNTDL